MENIKSRSPMICLRQNSLRSLRHQMVKGTISNLMMFKRIKNSLLQYQILQIPYLIREEEITAFLSLPIPSLKILVAQKIHPDLVRAGIKLILTSMIVLCNSIISIMKRLMPSFSITISIYMMSCAWNSKYNHNKLRV